MRAIWQAVAALASVAACEVVEPPAPPTDEPVGYGPGLGTAENPIPQDHATYTVRSRIERDSSADVDALVAPLRAFSLHPGQAMLATATDAQLSELATLEANLSPALMSQLAGWIDAELDAVTSTTTARDIADQLADDVQTALTTFTFAGTMSFTAGRVTHTITGIEFHLYLDAIVPVGGLKADSIVQQASVSVEEAGRISFGEHQFALAFGQHAWHAINLVSQTLYAAAPAAAIASHMDCGALAESVASRCIDTECVGHSAELQGICEQTVTLLASNLGSGLTTFDATTVHYVAGTAHLVDDDRDGLATAIADGVWSPELMLGPARGTFTATAEDDARF
jgi:hypothetical protein